MGREQAFSIETAGRTVGLTVDSKHKLLLEASDVAAERTAPPATKAAPNEFALYYSIAEATTGKSTAARWYVLCLQAIIEATLRGATSCYLKVSYHHAANISYHLQQMGFDASYEHKYLDLSLVRISWS